MISRVSISQQISKGGKVGRPAGKKYKQGQRVSKIVPGVRQPKKKKDVNVPGEKARGYEGYVSHMVSMAEGRFNKMMKDIKAKRRTPHKG